MNERLGPLAPEIILAASATALLLAGSWLPRRRQWIIPLLSTAACLAALAVTAFTSAGAATVDFGTSYVVDVATNTVRVIATAATVAVIGLGARPLRAHPRETEFYVLLQLSALGTITLAGAGDLLMLFAAYLLASVPGYALAGLTADDRGTEAALKYYLMGALFSVIMLAGITLLDGAGHATSYPALRAALPAGPHGVAAVGVVAVAGGLLFKCGAVPAHFWVPDVTEGTSIPVATFVTTVPKLGGFAALIRLLATAIPAATVDWPLLVAITAAVTMTLGNLAAFFQASVRRLLAYSAISQAGYLLMAVAVAARSGIAVRSLLFYLLAYAATNVAAFAVAAALPHARVLGDYRGLAARHPALAAVLVVSLLGLVGTPPAGVFVGKLEVFTAAIYGGYGWLAGLAAVNTVASLFYYLRWLAPVFRPPPTAGPAGAAEVTGAAEAVGVVGAAGVLQPGGRWAAATAYAAGAASLVAGLGGAILLPLVTGHLAG